MDGSLVELAQRFVRLSGRDAMRRLFLNGAGGPSVNPTPARRPGAKRPQSKNLKVLRAAEVEETILKLLQSSRLRTAAIARATAAQRSTTDERLKRLQAKDLVERDAAGWRAPA